MILYSETLFRDQLLETLRNEFNVSLIKASLEQIYSALCIIARSELMNKRHKLDARTYGKGGKQVFYMSMEFLIGRSLKNNLFNLGMEKAAETVLNGYGIDIGKIYDTEADAGLGNGGLGRLAACYLDALASTGYNATGYSILYEYGVFKQKIVDGWQQETLDDWMKTGEIWLDPRPDEAVEVNFGGYLKERWDNQYHSVNIRDCVTVQAVPYDFYISGYDSDAVSRLRLWKAKSPGFDMASFNRGDYTSALKANNDAELISKVLYPNDNHMDGKILRLRQQYFLCCASVNNIVKNHLAQYGTLENLPDKVVVQLNDTHPTLAIPELMRIMLDECGYTWDDAESIASRIFNYTNHTIMQEALEQWSCEVMKATLPRIYQIIEEINRRFCEKLYAKFPGDTGKVSYMSIISKSNVRMANLCIAMSGKVNGVAKIHSDIIKEQLFHDFSLYRPDQFTNVTNGIAYRRWLLQHNLGLCGLLNDTIGEEYKKDATRLEKLASFRNDSEVLERLASVKRSNKEELIRYASDRIGYPINPDSIFDVQAKRVHEYKRQHLNALNIIRQYLYLKDNPNSDFVPKTYFFSAKAAPGYYMAKQIIRFLCGLQTLMEKDSDVRERLRVVFLEEYSVSLSEILMPAAEISEQISLAGTEASGTGNMKLMLGGAVTIGTLDGANIEIRSSCGTNNFYLFGMTKDQVLNVSVGYRPSDIYNSNPEIKRVIDFLYNGFNGNSYKELADNLLNSDPYMVLADFASYSETQDIMSTAYKDTLKWNSMSLMNIAGFGYFSADRSVREYATHIWNIRPV